MEKQFIIIEPGLTTLNLQQIISKSDLNKAKKDFQWSEDYQTFTYKEYPSSISFEEVSVKNDI